MPTNAVNFKNQTPLRQRYENSNSSSKPFLPRHLEKRLPPRHNPEILISPNNFYEKWHYDTWLWLCLDMAPHSLCILFHSTIMQNITTFNDQLLKNAKSTNSWHLMSEGFLRGIRQGEGESIIKEGVGPLSRLTRFAPKRLGRPCMIWTKKWCIKIFFKGGYKKEGSDFSLNYTNTY